MKIEMCPNLASQIIYKIWECVFVDHGFTQEQIVNNIRLKLEQIMEDTENIAGFKTDFQSEIFYNKNASVINDFTENFLSFHQKKMSDLKTFTGFKLKLNSDQKSSLVRLCIKHVATWLDETNDTALLQLFNLEHDEA